ncbi:MAG TPA: nicotinate phosphoribosyltransferase [Blastocatellia bacterium]|nr:nicotinate phosphoribosyltransferase [Blastocatellia bacterium]
MTQRSLALSTDLYELAMAAAYFESGMTEDHAIFELFIRRLPRGRSFLITAGLEQALEYLDNFRLTSSEVEYVRAHPAFKDVSREFFDYLSNLRFTGDIWAMPEGTLTFGMEPILRVEAPIIEAQIVETFLLSAINFQTMIASKAARVVTAAAGRDVIEFGTRRAHGTEAGLYAARAAYIGGCIGTSNVEAGHLFGVPTFGTLAHSFVMSFDREQDAFRAFLKSFPHTATVLVDTYDTVAAVQHLASEFGSAVSAVRLDSGDLCRLSIEVRDMLDRAGMTHTQIFASGDLNENRIAELLADGARIDAFGVGTELATSYDSPALSGVYKLVALRQNGEWRMRVKLSEDKHTYPGAKQVWRIVDESGTFVRDVVALEDETGLANILEREGVARPLVNRVMTRGKSILPIPSVSSPPSEAREQRFANLKQARARSDESLKSLPRELRSLDSATTYSVSFSNQLRDRRDQLERDLRSVTAREGKKKR